MATEQPSVASGALKKNFKEQVAFFRNKLRKLVPTSRWDDLKRAAHDRAFMVAGAMKTDLLADLGDSLDRAISEGESLEAFRKDFFEAIEKHNWHGWTGETSKRGRAWRTRIIYQTNTSTAYAAGRYAQLQEGGFALWVYRHNDSVRHPRPQHQAWDGIARPPSHPFWVTHYPPNGWLCHCYVVGARSDKGARRMGGDPDKAMPPDWDKRQANNGMPPGIDKGWDYAPGASVAHTVNALKAKLNSWPAALGASFWAQEPPPAVRTVQQEQWETFFDKATNNDHKTQGKQFTVGALSKTVVSALQQHHPDLMPATAGIVITDKAIGHMLRHKKFAPVADEWLRQLPMHLQRPDAVLVDQDPKGAGLLFVYTQPKGTKLVVHLDYQLKKNGKVNLLKTARKLDDEALASIRGMLNSGQYDLLEGSL